MTNVEIKYQICVRLRDEKIYGYAQERTLINLKKITKFSLLETIKIKNETLRIKLKAY